MLVLAFAALRAAAEPAVRYTLDRPPDGNSVQVTASFPGDQDGVSDVSVVDGWGGITADLSDFQSVSASGDDGRALQLAPGAKTGWSITHNPGEQVTLAYRLVQPPDRTPLGPGHNDYRTRVGPELFQMIGNHGLLYPAHLGDGVAREHEVRWTGFDLPGFHAVSSFGTGAVQTVTIDGDRFRQGLFIAGKLALVEKEIKGTRVGVVISGTDWGFTPEQFADVAFTIIAAERDFFNDYSDPWYLVSVTPEGKAQGGSFSLGGTALTNCFALYCNAGLSMAEGSPHVDKIQHVLAHEYFHTWNGVKFHIDGAEGENYWFSEGFTEYFTRRMLRKAGLWDDAALLADLNRSIAEYDTMGRKNATNQEIQKEFWTDPDISRLPYRRGDLLALAIDEQIRSRTGGRRTLDHAFRDLIRGWPQGTGSPDRAQLLKSLAVDAGEEFIDSLIRVIENGEDPALPRSLSEFSADLSSGASRSFDAGFDVKASSEAKKLIGVKPGSGAAEAGLKEGMPFRRSSIGQGEGPNQPPKGEAEVEIDGDWMKINYDALGPVKQVRVYRK